MNTSYALLALGVGVLSIFLLLMVITMGIRSYQRHGLTAGKKKKIYLRNATWLCADGSSNMGSLGTLIAVFP